MAEKVVMVKTVEMPAVAETAATVVPAAMAALRPSERVSVEPVEPVAMAVVAEPAAVVVVAALEAMAAQAALLICSEARAS